jgi:glycosyltransferase involved in cell wall biosynthesis
MKIAMIGQKGVPAAHGGIERHVEELSAHLVELGHDVTVFTRPNYSDPTLVTYRGITLRSLPTVGTKHLDAIVHSVLATFMCWAGAYDIVHYHAIGPCLASPLARVRGRHVVATIHGRDWLRGKWGRFAATVLHLGEWMALRVPNETICVSESLTEEYRQDTGRSVRYVPNGITIVQEDDVSVLEEYGLEPGEYLFCAGRLVPEKGVHYLIEARRLAGVQLPLVVAGGTSASDEYVNGLREMADEGVVFVGYQYGARLAALFRHAGLFVLPSDLEGLPIVLLEAIAYGIPVLASDIAPNRELLGAKGSYFSAGNAASLAEMLVDCVGALPRMRAASESLRSRAVAEYDWRRIAVDTVRVYEAALGRRQL